jgi:hypothetical protein
MQTATPWRAVLVPDSGRLALCAEYFRSEHHLRAEQVTHSLVLEGPAGHTLRIPLVVRPIPGTPFRDASSPYGFPGAAMEGPGEVPRDAVDWRGVELVSVFVRDRIGGPYCFSGGTVRTEVSVIDPDKPVAFRETHRRHIRRNARLGYRCTLCRMPDASPEEREGLKAVYRQTMVRDRASPRYFFDDAWFDELFASPLAWLVTVRAPGGEIASAASAVLSDGCVHYYIAGTADAFLAQSPAKNVIAGVVELATELRVCAHLGGGQHPGDGIEQFKRGFANATSHFRTHELVCDPALYARLCRDLPSTSDYFPAYRRPH